jgi:ABC-type uncharacterized transport system involved in gliding motility auxiliary subunit
MNKQILSSTSLIIALALFLAVNIASDAGFKSLRLDLTENQLYTLSEGTKNILQNIEEPITLRLYLSEKLATGLPSINSYAVQVRELLQEYQRLAGDKLQLKIIDPEPFSEQEDRAVGFGLQGIPTDEANTTFYFGLAGTNSTDDEQIIPFFTPSRAEFLEYDVTQLLYQLAHPKQKVVGIMSGLPIMGSSTPFAPSNENNQSWMVVEHLRQQFEVRELKTDITEIPDDVNVLMLVYPKGLSDATLYAIDQYVLNGGHALVFVDPYSEAYQPPTDPNNPLAGMQMPRNSELTRLLEAWGVDMETDKTVGELQTAQKVQVRKGSGASVITYPVWMNLDDNRYFNKENIITAKLGNIMLGTPGALTKKDGSKIEFTPLIQTGDKAMKIATNKLGFFADPESLVRDFKSEAQFTLAAHITGKITTAFADGKPKADKDEEDEDTAEDENKADDEHLTESVGPINLIIVADTDLLEDKFWVRVQNFLGQRIALPHAVNATFVANAIDNLSGSNDLISVRNRGNFARPFTLVEEIQREAEQKFREKEKELLARLQETDQKIQQLQRQKKQDSNKLMLSIEQQQEIDQFRQEKIKIRKELRHVQHQLHKNIEQLNNQMAFINIGLMPLLIGFGSLTLSMWNRRRRKKLVNPN